MQVADCSSLDADVLVLGAGMAGITAATTLSQDLVYNISNFLILEGMDDIGGRVRSGPFGGVNVELGANWIEGILGKNTTQVNPLHYQFTVHKIPSNLFSCLSMACKPHEYHS